MQVKSMKQEHKKLQTYAKILHLHTQNDKFTSKGYKMTTVVQFRMDSEDKELLDAMLKDMGLDIGTACRMFARKVLQTGTIPFSQSTEIDESTIMTKANLKAYKKAKKDLENGEAISLEELKRKYL